MAVSDQIIKVLDALCEKFGVAIDWTAENVIPYITTLCEKLVTWEIWSSVAWIGIMAVLSIISIVLAIVWRRALRDSLDHGEGAMLFPYGAFVIIWVATAIVCACQTFDIIKCVTFPELFTFEYIQNLINSSK